MKNQTNPQEEIKIQVTVMVIITLACGGLIGQCISQRWEYWALPLLFLGSISMWVMYVMQYVGERFHENFCFIFTMFLFYYHGAHGSNFYDVAVSALLFLVTFSFFDRIHFLSLVMLEYIIIMLFQMTLLQRSGFLQIDFHTVLRLGLHILTVLSVFFLCRRSVKYRLKLLEEIEKKNEMIQESHRDMEDFLANISHELRTPINVVNGMSALILKNERREDVEAIKDAGFRLSNQIEDIQDYTEIKRGEVVLEEEAYSITSLMNDFVENIRMREEESELEVVIDLDPNVPAMMKGDVKKLRKILRHLIDNAFKFTEKGGICVRITAIPRKYGVNLNIEVSDTGNGMSRKDISQVSKGFYQANKKRNRSNGGIGLGVNVVYGFIHKMEGFVKIESEKGNGTSVFISIPQETLDYAPCLAIDHLYVRNIIFHVRPEKYSAPKVREFYREMAVHLAAGLKVNLYAAPGLEDVKALLKKMTVTHIFMGCEEYVENFDFFEELGRSDIVVAVLAPLSFRVPEGSGVILMPKPLYSYPVTRIINDGREIKGLKTEKTQERPLLSGIRTLIVDDEPMNLVVAKGLLEDYKMIVDTARSGKEAIEKYLFEKYDLIFMDHMMPEMDGVETMKRIRKLAADAEQEICIVALTANAVSGAKKMFLKEGFDGFISKPIEISDFERVMRRVMSQSKAGRRGGTV